MAKRLMTAFFGVLVLIPFAVFSHTFALLILTVFMSGLGVYEVLKCVGKEKNIYLLVLAETVSASTQILARVIADDNTYLAAFMMITIVFFVLVLSAAVFTAGKESGRVSVSEAMLIAVMTVYVSFGFSSLTLLRDMEYGIILFILWFFLPWICDGMAYFVGRACGRRKLIPAVSPKKTVEGAIGGVIGTLVLMMAFALVMQLGFGYTPNYPVLILVTLVGCPISMCGDLI
ncbi:MAG: phosphatidate cytidylyltransferase, partial [Clostridia bacterium]|nr:phosphatidate cytidylyltransferase [Clostridia bacterium]